MEPTMKFMLVSTHTLVALGAGMSLWCLQTSKPPAAAPAVSLDGTVCITHLPTAFVPNFGQWRHAARYVARIGTTAMFLEPDGWTLTQTATPRGAEKVPFRGTAA